MTWYLPFKISIAKTDVFAIEWLDQEKTRGFCRQVNKKISSCFWTASTCVQRSSLGWSSRLTYMETVDWIHVGSTTNRCTNFKFWIFWEHPPYEIWEYAFKFNYLSIARWLIGSFFRSQTVHACGNMIALIKICLIAMYRVEGSCNVSTCENAVKEK